MYAKRLSKLQIKEVIMQKLNRKFIFWLDDDTYNRLKALADAEKSSMGRMIRVIIDAALSKSKLNVNDNK
jgi:polysaccharide deacetylase 2 family uncharacterized protein YibQ